MPHSVKSVSIIDMMEYPKLKNEPRPKFISFIKKSVYLEYFRSYFLVLLLFL